MFPNWEFHSNMIEPDFGFRSTFNEGSVEPLREPLGSLRVCRNLKGSSKVFRGPLGLLKKP